MKRWEYLYVHQSDGGNANNTRAEFLGKLNKSGSEGWRVVPLDVPMLSGLLMEREIPKSRTPSLVRQLNQGKGSR
jgi:hypothetical protein